MEVETRTLKEVEELMGLVESGRAPAVTRIMLDNMAQRDAAQPGAPDFLRLIACLVWPACKPRLDRFNGSFDVSVASLFKHCRDAWSHQVRRPD